MTGRAENAVFFCCVSVIAAVCLSGPAQSDDPSPQLRTVEHQGQQRSWFIVLPAGYRPEIRYWPLVVVHGGGGNAGQNAKALTMRRIADEQGLPAILILPEFITEDKQVSRFPTLGEDAFLKKVLANVRAEFKVHQKILLNGYSMGGQFSHRFALAHPDLVQACAPFAAGTWSTPDGKLLIEQHGAVDDPQTFLSAPENAEKIPERLRDLFDSRVAEVAGLTPATGMERVPFLVMCGTLDTRYDIAVEFSASLRKCGFTVDTAWPVTPHGSDDGKYQSEFEKYGERAIEFFRKHTER